MTDEIPTGRDKSGRFVKRVAEKAQAISQTPAGGVHPMSGVMFGWTEARHTGAIIFWGMAILSVALVVVDLVILRRETLEFAHATGFYGLWGFGAFAFAVLAGWPLGYLLRRRENFYGDAGGPPADIDPEAAAHLGPPDWEGEG